MLATGRGLVLADSARLEVLAPIAYDDVARPTGDIAVRDGVWYGVTTYGGEVGDGTLYVYVPGAGLEDLHDFVSTLDGANPVGGLIVSDDGNLYGLTQSGGGLSSNDMGTLYRVAPDGEVGVVFVFNVTEGLGYAPQGSLVEGPDGALYGVTINGGRWLCGPTGCGSYGDGVVFRVTKDGVGANLHNFSGRDGRNPVGGLLVASDGNLYGVTLGGGRHGLGTVYRIGIDGAFATLHDFSSSDGASGPSARLLEAADGWLYGVTLGGGNADSLCYAGRCGTIFRVSRDGTFERVHAFSFIDGNHVETPLSQGADGTLYGTTLAGGDPRCILSADLPIYGCGTGYRITPEHGFETLFVLDGNNGFNISAPLEERDGILVTTTHSTALPDASGGALYRVTIDSETHVPVVTAVEPIKGPVGTGITIHGKDLGGATGVLFDGIPASFVVDDDTTIRAVVPSGFRRAPVEVRSLGGSGESPRSFRVTRR